MIILGTNSIKGSGSYDVANSCRFNSGDSAVLKRTHGTPTNAKKFVWSAWIKRSKLGADQYFVQNYTDGSNLSMIYFRSGDDIRIFDRHGTGDGTDTVWISDAKFIDVSAWIHILLKVDTTQSTDSERFKVFINGILAGGNGITYPALNADMNFTSASASNRHSIAATSDGYNYFGGYLCEVALIDGTSPDHTDFGEFDSDSPTIWKPKDVSSLTFGNNGYYLDFADSADLGDDESGNGNDFAETNLATTDQSLDTCTNNFANLNNLSVNSSQGTFSEGNLQLVSSTTSFRTGFASIGATKGKWYCEIKRVTATSFAIGVISLDFKSITPNITYMGASGTPNLGYLKDGNTSVNGSETSGYASYGNGDTLMIALDLDNGKVYFGNGGTWGNSGDPTSGSSGTGARSITVGGEVWSFGVSVYNGTAQCNFGSPPYAITSSNSDGNGYGNFEYTVPANYYSLNTKNLAEYG